MTQEELRAIESDLRPKLALLNIDFKIFEDEYDLNKFSLKGPVSDHHPTPHIESMIPSTFERDDLLMNIADYVQIIASTYIWMKKGYIDVLK